MTLVPVNYLAVLVAAVVSFLIGFLWHGPLFGKTWLRLSNISDAEVQAAKEKGGMGKPMLAAFVQQLVIAYILALFVAWLSVADAMGALTLAFWIWLGFQASILLNGVLWEKRSMNLYLFSIAYYLVSLAAMAVILTLWK